MAILVFVAHPDDFVTGAGGTIAKYSVEKEHITAVIFSYGEGSDPSAEPTNIIQQKVRETKKAANILGVKDVIFLGLSDLRFSKDAAQPATKKKISDILNKYKPEKIFTHSHDDVHPAHKGVASLIKNLSDELKPNAELLSFVTDLPIKFSKRDVPRVYIDVSKTHNLKINALKIFKSQKYLHPYFIMTMSLRDWLAGFRARCKYAEVFYKI